jgi:hypothetical protein
MEFNSRKMRYVLQLLTLSSAMVTTDTDLLLFPAKWDIVTNFGLQCLL